MKGISVSDHYDPETATQSLPTPNNREAIHSLVQKDLQERLEFGTKKYGTPLQAFNGRNALQDAYEEILDLACYLKQCLVENEETALTREREFEAIKAANLRAIKHEIETPSRGHGGCCGDRRSHDEV